MDVILLERIEKLGHMGDVVKVKPGFARNYLLPQKKALRATKDNLASNFDERRADQAGGRKPAIADKARPRTSPRPSNGRQGAPDTLGRRKRPALRAQ